MSFRYHIAERSLRMLLYLYPRPFRRRYGGEVLAAFEDRYLESAVWAGNRRLARSWLRTATDIAVSALRERFDDSMTLHRTSATDGAGSSAPDPRNLLDPRRATDLMDTLIQDIRFALRSLVKRPGFTAAAIATLALAIGANTAIFSVVNSVLLRSLPYPDPDGLVQVWAVWEGGSSRGSMSWPDTVDIEKETDAIRAATGFTYSRITLTGMGDPEVVRGSRVTKGLLEVFDLEPTMGRDIRAEDSVADGPHVVMISHAFWQERLGGDPDVLGTTLELEGVAAEIVGVSPERFRFPSETHLWVANYVDPEDCGRDCHMMRAIARLDDGATVELAQQQLDVLAAHLEQEYPEDNFDKTFLAVSLMDQTVGDVRAGLFLLLGAVGMVLLIACANVANLLLVHGAARTGEIAVRSAMGASRRRLLQQLLIESLVLAICGGAAGLLIARGGISILTGMAPDNLPRLDGISLDATVLAFTAILVVVVSIVFGLAPAVRLARTPLTRSLHGAGRGSGADGLRGSGRSALLVAEVALSVMLLLGAGLMLRSFANLRSVPMGFVSDDVVRFALQLPPSVYDEPDETVTFFEQVEAGIAALPGVEAVGSAFGTPLGFASIGTGVIFSDRPAPTPGQEEGTVVRVVTPDYFDALRTSLLRGRAFALSDRHESLPVAIVSRSFAERFYPEKDPIGEQIRVQISFSWEEPERTIVGVAEDIRSVDVRRAPRPEVYVPQAQMAANFMTVLVRSTPGAAPILPAVREVVRAIDANVPLRRASTLSSALDDAVGNDRFYLFALAAFAGLAVILAAIGLYGVVAYLVSRRTHEIAVRIALGASENSVTRMMFAQGLRPAVLGVVLGVVGAFAASRVLASLLYGIDPQDPVSYGVAAALVAIVAATAILVPARRASRVAPATALKQQ